MRVQKDTYNHLVKLQKGDLLVDSLTKLVKDEAINGSWLMALGAAQWVEAGYYDFNAKAYKWKKYEGPLEVLSLQGNVGWDGDEPMLHIHGVFSGHDGKAFGGHVKEIEAIGTIEVFLHNWWGNKLTRSTDEESGLKLLDL